MDVSGDSNTFTNDLFLGKRGGKFLYSRLTRAALSGLHWYHYAWLILLFYIENILYFFSLSLLANRLRILYVPAIAYGAQSLMFSLFVALLLVRVEQYRGISSGFSRGETAFEGIVLAFCIGYILDKVAYLILWCKRRSELNKHMGDVKEKKSVALKWENIPLVTGYIVDALLILSLLGFIVTDAYVLSKSNNVSCSNNSTQAIDVGVQSLVLLSNFAFILELLLSFSCSVSYHAGIWSRFCLFESSDYISSAQLFGSLATRLLDAGKRRLLFPGHALDIWNCLCCPYDQHISGSSHERPIV